MKDTHFDKAQILRGVTVIQELLAISTSALNMTERSMQREKKKKKTSDRALPLNNFYHISYITRVATLNKKSPSIGLDNRPSDKVILHEIEICFSHVLRRAHAPGGACAPVNSKILSSDSLGKLENSCIYRAGRNDVHSQRFKVDSKTAHQALHCATQPENIAQPGPGFHVFEPPVKLKEFSVLRSMYLGMSFAMRQGATKRTNPV